MPQVVYTRPREERRAEKHLIQQGYVVFLPLCRTRRTTDPQPLFPRYLFVWIWDGAPVYPISNTPGVSYLLRKPSGEPESVAESEIDKIRKRMDADGGAILLESGDPLRRSFNVGDRIKVIDGPLFGLEGVFSARSGDRITALFNILGRETPTVVPEACIA